MRGASFFPLDEKLALLPTAYSPTLVETMVRLGTRLPFAQVADELARLFGVAVSTDTVRRLTENHPWKGDHLPKIWPRTPKL